jgi:hypothetical protein
MSRVLADILRLPVRARGIELGRPVDVIIDPARERALGFDVLCRDESHRFLPLTAAVIDDDQISVESALTLLSEDQLEFYRTRGTSVRELMPLLDVVTVGPDGALVHVASGDAA